MLDSLLSELLPRKVRLWVYLIVLVAMLVFTAFQAAEGDWLLFVLGLLGSFQSSLAAGNINPPQGPAPDPRELLAYGLHLADDKQLLREVVNRGTLTVDSATASTIPENMRVQAVEEEPSGSVG